MKGRAKFTRRSATRAENKILHLKELERVDSPLDRATRCEWDEPWRFELKMAAARFLTGNKGGQLSNARTEILPHQIFAAHRVVSSPKRRFLLADEVGLGKTIEAGMVWQALAQRGQARRTLILTPAGLTLQWQEEMQDKFGAVFITHDGKVDDELVEPAVTGVSAENVSAKCTPPDSSTAFETARTHVETKVGLWDWVDDVEFLGMSWIEFK